MATQETRVPREDISEPVATDRFAGGTAVQPQDQTDNALLLRHHFVEQKDQLITGEVSPREQDSEKSGGDQEMVVTTLPDPPSDASGGGRCISEESQPDGGGTQLVPNPGYRDDSHDRLRGVSKDWVLNQLSRQDQSHKQEIRELKDEMSQMKARFEEQSQQQKQQLAIKQQELDRRQAELEAAQKQVRDLKEQLGEEAEARQRAEDEKSVLEEQLREHTEQVKQKETEIEALKVEIVKLREELEQAEKDHNKDDVIEDLRCEIRSQTDLLNEMCLQQKAQSTAPNEPPSDSQPSTPIAGQFTFTQGAQPNPHLHEQRIVFSPQHSHTETDHQCKHSSSVDL